MELFARVCRVTGTVGWPVNDSPKKLAYADPPYYGQGKRLYGKLHPEADIWDDVDTHLSLLWGMDENYDGWAYCMTTTSLALILPNAPECRVAAWVKPFAAWRPNHRVQYTWEPVLFKTSLPRGGRGIDSVRLVRLS